MEQWEYIELVKRFESRYREQIKDSSCPFGKTFEDVYVYAKMSTDGARVVYQVSVFDITHYLPMDIYGQHQNESWDIEETDEVSEEETEDDYYSHPSLTPAERNPGMSGRRYLG